jgi:hypothetical protein
MVSIPVKTDMKMVAERTGWTALGTRLFKNSLEISLQI